MSLFDDDFDDVVPSRRAVVYAATASIIAFALVLLFACFAVNAAAPAPPALVDNGHAPCPTSPGQSLTWRRSAEPIPVILVDEDDPHADDIGDAVAWFNAELGRPAIRLTSAAALIASTSSVPEPIVLVETSTAPMTRATTRMLWDSKCRLRIALTTLPPFGLYSAGTRVKYTRHELGHAVFGLDHDEDPRSIMFPVAAPEIPSLNLTAHDRALLGGTR